jgi:hypothetical protein
MRLQETLQTIGRELDRVREEYPRDNARQVYLTGYEDGLRFCLECVEKVRLNTSEETWQ